MILFRSDLIKVASLTTILIAIVLITIIIAESPNLRDVDLKLLPNNISSKLVPKPSREEPAPAAQQPNPNYLGNNNLGNLNGRPMQQNLPPNYPSLIGMLAPALLPGLNSAEQQISPYQLRNASPQQLQRLRQMQEMQQLQRQQGGAGPLTNLIGAFLPGGGQLLGGGLNQANNRLNNNNLPNGQVGNQNPATLAQLLGLTPQQPLNNPYNQLSQLNNPQRANVYGQPNRNARPNANLRRANPESEDSAGNNADNNSVDNSGEGNAGDNSGNEDNSGDNAEGGNDQSNQQQDPSQDPDIQQFNNLNGNDGNFPGDLFPAGILSENDLKDIQKSMEEQAKKEAEKQRQQEAANGQGEGEGEGDGNSEDNGEGSDQTNSDDQSNTSDQSADDQSANQEEDANQTESPQDEANSELKNKNEQDTSKDEADPSNNGKLNVGAAPKTGLTGNTILANKKPPTINSYSYNSLRPNGIGNGNSNVQYEDDRPSLNAGRPGYRPNSYASNANLPANRNLNSLQRQRGYGQQDDPYRTPGAGLGVGYGRDRFQNDFRPSTRFNNDLPAGGNPFASNYGSTVDYSPEYNQDPTGGGLYGASPGADYNPMSNYRPNELLNNHVSRQHGDINNFNYNLRPRTRNPLNAGRTLDRSGLANGLGDRSAVSYEPE